jgi:RHS repeat-associated protein
VIQERNSSDVPLVTYVRGLDLSGSFEGAVGIGGMLSRTAHTGANGSTLTHAFYHADANGNITKMVNSSQTSVADYKYDPFGLTISSSGILANANTYRFSSKELMGNSGFYCYGFRFYDPITQRWPSRDPIEEDGGINLYRFVRNSAIGFYDRFGLAPEVDRYPNPDAVACQALKDINPTSKAEGREYAGRIYQNPDDLSFSYTKPRKGTEDTSSPGPVPKGTKGFGSYLTHGSAQPGKGDIDEFFSGRDLYEDYAAQEPGYLGTPKSDIYKHTPKKKMKDPTADYMLGGKIKKMKEKCD